MNAYVVDTNVPIVANGREDRISPTCVWNCIRKLRNLRNNGIVVLDSGMLILREYMANLSMSGQPGPGDLFMKWIWQNQSVPERCEQVSITTLPSDSEDFREFPRDARLTLFDRKDRKFVAVACASKNDPEVLNATDSDWWIHRQALGHHGVRVVFLCPERFAN
ncbi:MAG: hypothetical protein V1790_07780 [Planctomycetota bacterium]